jgi:hypothetical protein
MTTDTTANNLDAYFAEIDAEIYQSSDAANAEAERRRQQYEQNKAAAILAIDDYLATLDEPVADLMRRSRQLIKEAGNSHSARIIVAIETQGIEKIVIESSGYANPNTASIQEVRTGHQSWSNCTPENLRAAIVAARAEWLQQHQEKRQAEQRHQEHRAALSAALAAWEPDYRSYLIALDAAYTHNARIIDKIAAHYADRPFEVRRLTYAIVYGEGADPTTDTTWIASRSTRNETEEIDGGGIIFDTRYYHPVSVTAPQTWTPSSARDAHFWSTDRRPPLRRYELRSGPLSATIYAPPSRRPLDAEIEDAIFHEGSLLDWPIPPAPPKIARNEDGEIVISRAADLAARHLSTAAHEAIGEFAIREATPDSDFDL